MELVWSLAATGLSVISEVPATRWSVDSVQALPEPMSSRARHAGFMNGTELVDNLAFGMSSAETAAMDPQQRLLLERGYSALHEAQMDRAALHTQLAGVFLGYQGSEFGQLLAQTPAGSSVYAATGSATAVACGRI
eukprot:7377296-Prymnesium_polylepis.1